MYHNRIGPGGPGPGPQPSRLGELLENIRQEFDQQAGRTNEHEHQLHQQIGEMQLVRDRIIQLETTHNQMKQRYEEEINRLRHELEQRGGPSQGSHTGPAQPPPPSIGHGPANLFQGIMAGGGQGGPGLAPPQAQEQQGQPGMPGHMQGQPPPGLNGPPGPPHNPFGYGQQQGQGPPPPPAGINGYPPPQQTASPAPGNQLSSGGSSTRFALAAPVTPHQSQPNTYSTSPGNIPRPTPPIDRNAQIAPDFQYSHADLERIGNSLIELHPDKLPPHLKRVADEWHVVYNPQINRTLGVDLVHSLEHQSVVCCVRFSRDARYVATGCNRSAQIFDVETGGLFCQLQDTSADSDGDLYIRSVCFSPDGKYLATGAEDKIIRVWDINARVIRNSFSGHDQDIYSLDWSRDGRVIASGSGDRTIRLWDVDRNQCTLTLQIEDGVTTVAISPDSHFVAAGSLDKSVRIWNMSSGNIVMRTEGEMGHKDSVYSVAFTPNGRELVSGSLDKTIKMWELRQRPGGAGLSGECLRTFEGHRDFVLSVASTPESGEMGLGGGVSYIMSGSKDRGVVFWDVNSGVPQLLLQGHKNSVISVAPSPISRRDGGLFATGSGDMTAKIWRYYPYKGT